MEEKDTKNNTKVEAKNTNKVTIIAIVAVVALVILILIGATLMSNTPKKAVEEIFAKVKSGAEENTISEALKEDLNEEAQKAIFENLSWKILNQKEEGDTATVEVEITNKDFGKIIDNFKEKIVKAAFNGESIDEAKTQEYLLEEINNEEIENVTNTHSITVVKQDGKWQVSEENDIIDILLPGFTEAINTLS